MAQRPPCPECHVEDLLLADADGRAVRARAYLPPAIDRVPAVVITHGYLANLAFMEVPWAADLAAIGAATLFIDRRGHGRSVGTGSMPHGEGTHSLLPPDLAAALGHARRHSRIDPERIALLGHSDGATSALVAASADPRIVATVAISASVAPARIVNHVTPRDLLLVYGEADRYVLHDTDLHLIRAATRGVLAGPGSATTLAGFNPRRLLRVPDSGHVDTLFSAPARHAALTWLGRALHLTPTNALTPPRTIWVVAGAASLLLGLSAIPLYDLTFQATGSAAYRPILALALFWPLGLAAALSIRHLLPPLPMHELDTVFALLIGCAASGLAVALWHRRIELRSSGWRRSLGDVRAMLRGMTIAAVTIVALTSLLRHYYDAWIGAERAMATAAISAVALPAFLAVLQPLSALSRAARGVALGVLACITVVLAPTMLERMAVFPAYLLAATLAYTAAVPCSSSAAAAFAALLFGRAAAAVCALR